MNVGVSTSCFYPLETERAFELVASHGIKRTEIFFNANSELKQSFVDILLAIQRKYEIKVTSVHPTMSLAESFMLFSGYERRLQEGLDDYKRYAEIAAMLGAEYIIMHGGKPNGVLDDRQYCERFAQIAKAVHENGATLLQENVVRYRAGSVDFLKMMADELGGEVGFCLDIKQCIRGGYSPFEAVAAVGKNIRHFHISDHTEASDCLLPDRGDFNFSQLFSTMESFAYKGSYIIEVYKNAFDQFAEIYNSYQKMCKFQ